MYNVKRISFQRYIVITGKHRDEGSWGFLKVTFDTVVSLGFEINLNHIFPQHESDTQSMKTIATCRLFSDW